MQNNLLSTPQRRRPSYTGAAGRAVVVCLLAVLALATQFATVFASDIGGKKGFSCFTGNAYIGAPYERVLTADPTNVPVVVYETFQQIIASDPPGRMAALADEIIAKGPDIAALQELWTLSHAPMPDSGLPEFTVVYDDLQLLTNALAAKGAHYRVAVATDEQDPTMPMVNPDTGEWAYASVTDHEAILVRTDLPRGQLWVTNPQRGRYTNCFYIPAFELVLWRGWSSVDVFVRGERFRFICTHLEDEMVPPVQEAQGVELVSGPANVRMPVIIVGDFNADPLYRTGTTTYDTLVGAGFKDAWQTLNPGNPAGGLTWGHDPFLTDPSTAFNRRIDFVFYRGSRFTPATADIMDPQISLTDPPLWPSDHATLSASFYLGNPKSVHAKQVLGKQ